MMIWMIIEQHFKWMIAISSYNLNTETKHLNLNDSSLKVS